MGFFINLGYIFLQSSPNIWQLLDYFEKWQLITAVGNYMKNCPIFIQASGRTE